MRPEAETIRARDGGYLDANDGVCDCNALIGFKSSEQERKSIACGIGILCIYEPYEDLNFGTPHRVVQSTYRALGFSPRHLDSLQLFGEGPSHPHPVFDNPLVGYGLHSPDNPLHLTKLVFDRFSLREINPTLFTSFDFSSLRRLKLKECLDLAIFFEHLMVSPHKINLEVLEIEICIYSGQFGLMDPFKLQHFIASFTTLNKFHLRVNVKHWPLGSIMGALQCHKSLKICNVFLAKQYMKVWHIEAMRIKHPMLKELGHSFHDITSAPGGRKLTARMIEDVCKLASKVVKLNQLEHWQAIFERPDAGVSYRAAETLARLMHKSCYESVTGDSACKIRKISVSFIGDSKHPAEHYMRAELVPETLEFFFPHSAA